MSVKNYVLRTFVILHHNLCIQKSNTYQENGNNISALLCYLHLRHLFGIRFMYE